MPSDTIERTLSALRKKTKFPLLNDFAKKQIKVNSSSSPEENSAEQMFDFTSINISPQPNQISLQIAKSIMSGYRKIQEHRKSILVDQNLTNEKTAGWFITFSKASIGYILLMIVLFLVKYLAK